jgi:hypothetical protein
MGKYPGSNYGVSRFSAYSASQFVLLVEDIKKRYGSSVLERQFNDEQIVDLITEKTEPEKQAITIYWVKEALREYHYRLNQNTGSQPDSEIPVK